MPYNRIAVQRDGYGEEGQVELQVGATVGKCRQKAARHWGWPAKQILLRSVTGDLLLDDFLVLRCEALLRASLRPHCVTVNFTTLGCLAAKPKDTDTSVSFSVELPCDGGATARSLKHLIARRLGISHAVFMLHAEEEELDCHISELDEDAASTVVFSEVEVPKEGGQDEQREERGDTQAQTAGEVPVVEDDLEWFPELLRVRRATREALRAAGAAKAATQAAISSVGPARAATANAVKAMQKEQAHVAVKEAEVAKAAFEVAEASAKEAAAAAQVAAGQAAQAEEALEAAKVVVEERRAAANEARERAKVVSKALQQARISRKQVSQSVQAAKTADAERDAAVEALDRAQQAEEAARREPESALEAAAAAQESAAAAAQAVEEAKGSARQAKEVAVAAQEAEAARARAWLEEAREAEAQAYAPPVPARALRDDEELDALGVRRVLCRLRPRAARLLTELRSCDELWSGMGAGGCRSRASGVRPWLGGVAQTRQVLSSCCATRNGDLAFQAQTPFEWKVALRGPRGSHYQGYTYWLTLGFPPEWPRQSPQIRFETPIQHPNIGEDGTVHQQATPFHDVIQNWSRADNVFAVLGAVVALLCLPDQAAVARPELARLLAEDPDEYARVVAAHASEHAVQDLPSDFVGVRQSPGP